MYYYGQLPPDKRLIVEAGLDGSAWVTVNGGNKHKDSPESPCWTPALMVAFPLSPAEKQYLRDQLAD